MSVKYDAIHWTAFKKQYDRILLLGIGGYLLLFGLLQALVQPEITAETMIIRATGSLAFTLLHIILVIGPLCRIDRHFLPILYNRRHLGVTMFLIGLVHGIFSIVQFHALSNEDPLVSVLTSNTQFDTLGQFPFQVFGLFALVILAVMAVTSHDFWLNHLSAQVWKTLHMGVYLAYAFLVIHVMLGAAQWEQSPGLMGWTLIGLLAVIGLHLAAALIHRKEQSLAKSKVLQEEPPAGFVFACSIDEIAENRAKLVVILNEHIAIFRYDGKISAVHNQCKHQGGPLSEGKILDGCITCPWHGYQYLPENGQSPPPFTEKVSTYDVVVLGKNVWVNPNPYPEGTPRPPAQIDFSNLQLP